MKERCNFCRGKGRAWKKTQRGYRTTMCPCCGGEGKVESEKNFKLVKRWKIVAS